MQTQKVQSRKPGIAKRIGWGFLFLFAIYPVLVSMGYLTFNPEHFSFAEQKAVYIPHLAMLMTHIIASMLAILIGPFQFLPGIRKGRLLKVHRWLGRTYLLSVLFGGLSGLYMATLSYGGVISHLGFAVLAVAWLYTGYRAYRHIRNKDMENHRRWMIRNYALTFAAVMLRIYVPLSGPAGFDFLTAYQIIAWLCWVPNLLVAEWIVASRNNAARVVQLGEAAQTDV
jgi:uncharacterized membrane protein